MKKREAYRNGLEVPVGKKVPNKIKKVRMPSKPKGKRDSEGRYNFSRGNLVSKAMDVLKPN